MSRQPNAELTDLVRALAGDSDVSTAPKCLAVERLRRLEEEARLANGDRQTLQRLISARRLLGDGLDLGATARGRDARFLRKTTR